MRLLYNYLCLILCFLPYTVACTEQGGGIPSGEEFKKTLKMQVNGQSGVGVMVVPKAPVYDIVVTLDERAELIKLTTCHREIIVERASFISKLSHKVSFKIQAGLENEGFCPINIGSFDKQGQHSWGMVEIKNESMDASLFCDGDAKLWHGVSVCQSRKGLLERVVFSYPVSYKELGFCGVIQTEDNKSFEFTMPQGQCIYLFKRDGVDSYHRLTVFGYNEILVKVIAPDNQFPRDDPLGNFGGSR